VAPPHRAMVQAACVRQFRRGFAPDGNRWVAASNHMKAKVQTRIDIDALRDIAGDKAFARGQVYHRDGMVEILSISQERIVAQGYRNQALEIFGDCGDLR
jgi:uncharacterized Zn finger protein